MIKKLKTLEDRCDYAYTHKCSKNVLAQLLLEIKAAAEHDNYIYEDYLDEFAIRLACKVLGKKEKVAKPDKCDEEYFRELVDK